MIFDKINSCDYVVIFGSFGMGKIFLFWYIENFKFWEEKGLDFLEVLIVYYDCDVLKVDNFW